MPTSRQPGGSLAGTKLTGPTSGGRPDPHTPRRGTRRWWLIGAIAAISIAGFATAALLWPRGDDDPPDDPSSAVARDVQATSLAGTAQAIGVPSIPATAVPPPLAAPSLQPSSPPASASASPAASAPAVRSGLPGSVVVTKPYGAAVRVSPASDARIALSLGCGSTLRVLGESAGWYRVALEAPQGIAAGVLEGFVGQLRVADAATAPRPDCSGAVLYRVNDPVVTSVQSGCLSLRETPSRSATILRCVENGTRYAIVNGPIEVDGEDWFEVSDPSIGRGWSLAQFLRPAR
jgi:hypothetical protein